jgi:hypothetical protein
MSEKKYKVIDSNNHVIAEGMALEYALLFMKAYCEEYFMEKVTLALKEHEKCECGADMREGGD